MFPPIKKAVAAMRPLFFICALFVACRCSRLSSSTATHLATDVGISYCKSKISQTERIRRWRKKYVGSGVSVLPPFGDSEEINPNETIWIDKLIVSKMAECHIRSSACCLMPHALPAITCPAMDAGNGAESPEARSFTGRVCSRGCRPARSMRAYSLSAPLSIRRAFW